MNFELGKLYRCTQCPMWEYQTVGEIYRCSHVSKDSIGMHRPTDGAGTFVKLSNIKPHLVQYIEI